MIYSFWGFSCDARDNVGPANECCFLVLFFQFRGSFMTSLLMQHLWDFLTDCLSLVRATFLNKHRSSDISEPLRNGLLGSGTHLFFPALFKFIKRMASATNKLLNLF